MKELQMPDMKQIEVTTGFISFPQYERLKKSAMNLAYFLSKQVVTEDNVKHAKKQVADVRKRVDYLEQERIRVKKKLLEPYLPFEAQVKKIGKIVSDSEKIVREQIKQLEETERERKKESIIILFGKRVQHYSFSALFTAEDFIQQRHLNKSMSLSKVEDEMVAWLEKTDRDIKMMKDLSVLNGLNENEVLLEYKITKEPFDAVENVKLHQKQVEAVKVAAKPIEQESPERKQIVFTVFTDKDAKLLEMFMEQNNINYKKGGI